MITEVATPESFSTLPFRHYWGTYFPDLIQPLGDEQRHVVLENLFDGFLDGLHAGRATVQRLIEAHSGVITYEQYASWSLSSEDDDGTEHVLAHAACEEYFGGDRASMLQLLAYVDYTPEFAMRMRNAAQRGLLSEWETRQIIATSLRTRPLPRLRLRPAGVPELPFTRVHYSEHELAPTG